MKYTDWTSGEPVEKEWPEVNDMSIERVLVIVILVIVVVFLATRLL